MQKSNLFFRSLFIIAVFLLMLIAGIIYRQLQMVKNSSKLVMHTYEVNLKMEQLFSAVKDAEASQRGYIITGETLYLDPYFTSLNNVKNYYNELKFMTADNLIQQQNLEKLNDLINTRFKLLSETLKLHIAGHNNDSLNSLLLKGENVMSDIRIHIHTMTQIENGLLDMRQKENDNQRSITPIIFLIVILFSLCIFILSYYQINEDANRLVKLNSNLLITNKIFEHAEEIACMSHWQWDLTTNKLTYSDNQYRLLGLEPQSIDLSLKAFSEFVHPDDRNILLERSKLAIKVGESPSAPYYFRVIRKDGELRYFKAIGKLTSDLHGNKILIGVTIDVTDQHLSELNLEEKNKELERSNAELESFNYLASHDLQEPIRKIQTFISRIIEKEKDHISESALDYFSRMQLSAHRMQKLIEYLLMYSRTNRTDQIFEYSDLNKLLDHAKQELSLAIEEKNATIISSPLPAIKVIPAQIQQLFINLISNSLKYSKDKVAPVININSEIVDSKDITELKNEPGRKYHKISVTDNGMGFEQEYAESIFLLFHRLHERSEFSGSGIGLSICKKIVENHLGFISAEGRPGEGATFNIYLLAS